MTTITPSPDYHYHPHPSKLMFIIPPQKSTTFICQSMPPLIRYPLLLLLLLNSVVTFYAGTSLLIAPDGSLLDIHVHFLEFTPFQTFIVPGLILIVANGVGGLHAAYLTLRSSPRAARAAFVQGATLMFWILFQVYLIHHFVYIQYLMLAIGISICLLARKCAHLIPNDDEDPT